MNNKMNNKKDDERNKVLLRRWWLLFMRWRLRQKYKRYKLYTKALKRLKLKMTLISSVMIIEIIRKINSYLEDNNCYFDNRD